MGMQTFELVDYFGVICVFFLFWLIIFSLCAIFNYAYITSFDDITVFEKIGKKHHLRLGPHSMAQILDNRPWASTLAYEQELRLFPMSRKRRASLVSFEFNLVNTSNIARSVAFLGKN